MSDVIMRIFSVIGILLLALLGLALLLLLLVLFFPVTYRVKGEKGPEKLWLTARADWLFGVLRVRYAYPEPGKATVKILWKTLVDMGPGPEPADEAEDQEEKPQAVSPESAAGTEGQEEKTQAASPEPAAGTECQEEKSQAVSPEADTSPESAAGAEGQAEKATDGAGCQAEEAAAETEDQEEKPQAESFFSRIITKIKKIKYTILEIYDKIEDIWENISYYLALLQDENTVGLLRHVRLRVGKVLKSIRPRRIRANVTFGTGAPDTTGYAFGVYGMLSPILGSKVCVTPDFTRAVLEGDLDVSGHITVWTCAWNALKLLLDKKLHLFWKKIKHGRKEDGR